ncbi:tetratricopeptide repeat protein [Ornithinimicrobium pekingense]|uniref:Tetratricopeptide repeat protein n=1 Tax=Ornithinimicrobium pekingense TaxID=384677 RepID=A0ABQ2F635_9MICO|nr:tetratricopeptide repeat protein [Ornithinimicrobium pekingense]GGK62653.1 hypothetical protein GCM10011509_08860 [Ornithinimicrobium pekingense]
MIQVYGGGEYPAYVIDDDTLREELLDPLEAREWCEGTPDHPDAVSFWRMLGELDRALGSGQRALHVLEPGTPRWAAAAVRLAHVHHWRGEYEEAHDLLDAAEDVFAGAGEGGGPHGPMLAFVHQHRAKALFDEGRHAEAAQQARRALQLREGHAATALVASTRQTLARILQSLGDEERVR